MRYLFAVLGLALSLPASAALQPPTDIDLKAAYCLRKTQIDLSALRPGVTVAVDRLISDAQDRLNRLQSYLLPRLQYLDAAGLLAASKRAEIDNAQVNQQFGNPDPAQQCTPNEAIDACVEKLLKGVDKGLRSRVQACTDLDWLPF
jgi:hypothetical protein